MLLLVLGRSLLVLFVGWEGVGLASYLLIGFWFEDAEKARAGKKAFITNRIGDAGFLLGMFLLYWALGTLDMDRINAAFGSPTPPAVSASLVGILLFIGATGKSAQIPLHVWLPDAMAGPTPVSALIHAATMVTAGVYLVARMSGLYLQAPEASEVIAVIGAATAFFAATIAIAQTDIKKVLAYSTVSQLGLMFVALGVGAYGVAIFHVYTHAFFKACLFLGAGSVIHALGGEQDIRKMGGLAKKIPVTFVTFAIATAAIAGIPPLAGFWSKDEILWFAFAQQPRRLAAALDGGRGHRAADRVLHVPSAVAHVPRCLADGSGDRASRARVAASMTSRADVVAGHLLRHRRLLRCAALPRVAAAVLPEPREGAAPLRDDAALDPVDRDRARRSRRACSSSATTPNGQRALGPRFATLHWLLGGKYFVDEAYDRLLGRPLYWVSDRVFLRLGDRVLLDGTLEWPCPLRAAYGRRAGARPDRQPAPVRAVRARSAPSHACCGACAMAEAACSTSSSSCRCWACCSSPPCRRTPKPPCAGSRSG